MKKGKKAPVIKELQKELKEITLSMDDLRSLSHKEKQKAKKALKLAKQVEETKVDYVWMHKDKSSKFVAPQNVKRNLADGWRLLKIKK